MMFLMFPVLTYKSKSKGEISADMNMRHGHDIKICKVGTGAGSQKDYLVDKTVYAFAKCIPLHPVGIWKQ